MNLVFSFFSLLYIGVIFFAADSPGVTEIEFFNMRSLLHIPLYGGLTFLLIFSMPSMKVTDLLPGGRIGLPPLFVQARLRFAAGISFLVAILDEIHQAFIPVREASILDVVLDGMGILCVAWIIRRIYQIRLASEESP